MPKRTIPDKNQKEVAEAINNSQGCHFIDTHNIPRNLPELTGFPDGLMVNENALTIFCNDPDAIIRAIQDVPGVSIWHGGIVPVEIKTEEGRVRDSQNRWGDLYGIRQVILRTIDDVFKMFNIT